MKFLLHHIIEDAAKRFPLKIAFKCGKKEATYHEILDLSRGVANSLVQSGIQKGDRVGIILNRCIETVPAIYGTLMAGAVYVPLDPYLPIDRLKYQLEDCGLKGIVSLPKFQSTVDQIVKERSIKILIGVAAEHCTSVSWSSLNTGSVSLPKILDEDLAYIIYTSGSTGKPKGIMHTHRSGLAYVQLTASHYQFNQDDVFGNHSPIHFDIAMLGYFTSPLVGATTVIATEAYTKIPSSLAQLIEKEKVSVWYSVPLALTQMLQKGAIDQRDFSALRWVLFAGEPMATKHLRSLMLTINNARFSNVYGPAELNQCTNYDLDIPPESDEPIPIGKAWENTEHLIINDKNEVINKGKGQLIVRSATMMKGYWNQPEMTQKSFFINQTDSGGEVFYRTGDLVEEDENGNLHFYGRIDRQIKVRGYRVELDDVGAAIYQHDDVQEVAVFDKQMDGETSIYAHVIAKEDKTLSESVLNSFVLQKLPAYAVPILTIVNELPRTSTGKIDYQKLRDNNVI